MPIYEYRCGKCGHTLEKIQKIGDARLSECPACGGPLEKLISTVAVQFKGGGWYADGYSGKTKTGSGASAAGGESGSKSDSKSDSKSSSEGGSSKPEPKKAAGGGCGSGSCGCH
jgi:putative FmdB family regulatory protein